MKTNLLKNPVKILPTNAANVQARRARGLPLLSVIMLAASSILLQPALKAGWQRSTLADDLATEDMQELAQVASELFPGQTLGQPMGATQTREAGDELKSLQGQPVETFQAPPDNVAGIQQIMAASMGLDLSDMGGIAPAAASIAPETLPEIKAIANALGNNAYRILKWVTTNIEYEPYNGLKRGPRRTAIERAGNSFDTAALTVALLRAAIPGVQASCYLTYRGMSRSDASIWLGVAPDQVERYLKDAGADYPGVAWVRWDSANVYFPHVLVKLTISGVPYYYDPSYKTYLYGDGVNLSTKANYTFTTFFNTNIANASSVTLGGQAISTFVGNTSVKPSVRNQLNTCATTLINNILNSDTDHDIDGREAAGGRWIDPNSPAVYTLTPGDGIDLPDNPADFCVRMSVTVGGITRTYNTADWGGKKISITFANKQATLYVDDIQDGASETGATAATAPVSITFSYPNGISYTETPAPLDRSGGTYVITYGFDHCLGMVKERMRKLAQLKEQNYAATSRELISENLYLIGLQYLNENNVINEIASGVTPVRMSVQHQAGIIGTSQAPFVDLPANIAAMGIRTPGIASGAPYDDKNPLKAIPTTDAMRTLLNKAMLADMSWTSMLEHSVIEQMIVTDANPSNQYLNSAVSTTKMIQWYMDSGQTVYLAKTSAQWAGLKNSLASSYPTGFLPNLDTVFSATMYAGGVLLPASYSQLYKSNNSNNNNSYTGMGYATLRDGSDGMSAEMALTGNYGTLAGGASTLAIDTTWLYSSTPNIFSITNGASPNLLSLTDTSIFANNTLVKLNDPVDASSGALTIDATDLSLGAAAPYGLAFTRHYSSALRYSDPTGLGKGWTHDYNIRVTFRHAGDFELARMGIAEAAPIIIATRAIFDSADAGTTTATTAKNWVVPALAACWLGDQFINTHAIVQMGARTLEFVKKPDGTYARPTGVIADLTGGPTTNNPNAGFTLQFRKGLKITFRPVDGYFDTITDTNTSGNTPRSLKASYTGSSTWNGDALRLTQVTDAYGRTLILAYNGTQLSSVTDSAGRKTQYGPLLMGPAIPYATAGFLYTDPEGKMTSYYWGSGYRITSIVDPMGRTTIKSEYDDYDRVITQYSMNQTARKWTYAYAPGVTSYTDPYNNTSYYYFDARGRRAAYEDENGNRTDWFYDGVDRLVQVSKPFRGYYQTDAQGNWLYDNQGNMIPFREYTLYGYDKNHELFGTQDWQHPATWITPYDPASTNPVTTVTSPGGLVTTTAYTNNLPTTITTPGGITENFTYDTWGRVATHHPAAYAPGKNITYTYTTAARYVSSIKASYPDTTAIETTTYNECGDITQTTDRAGVTTTYTYNLRRQPLTITVTASGQTPQVTQITYNDAGQKTSTVDPLGHTTYYNYNADDELLELTAPDGAKTTNKYDNRSQLIETKNPLGAKVTTTYDPTRRPDTITDPLNRTTYLGYDNLGNRIWSVTPNGSVTQTDYWDARLLPTQTTDPMGKTITPAYDADGRQTSLTNRLGNKYTTTYDNNNPLKVTTATPEQALKGIGTTTFTNLRGLMDTTIRPSDKIVKNTSFDSEGRVLTQTIYAPDGATPLATTNMQYDTAGRLWKVTENNKITTRTYDTLGRLWKYEDGEGNTITYGYDAANNLTTLTYPGNNLTVTYTYDECNRLKTVKDSLNTNRKTTYYYDDAGRLVQTDRANGTTRKQTYDLAGQLCMIEERNAAGALLWMRSLEYDLDGRITRTVTFPSSSPVSVNKTDTADHDKDNRLSKWNGNAGNVGFDPDGNMTTGPNPAGTAIVSYQYDPHNRLTGVNGATLYRYNPDGNCVQDDTATYVIDPNASLPRILKRNSTCYIWGANGIEYEIGSDGSTKTYHADHLGSTMLLTDGSGDPIPNSYFEYDSYGTQTQGPTTNTTPFRWHGTLGVITSDNGLINMRARFYSPRIMRFLNQDPIGFQGGMNWFAFVGGNPVSRVDPSGLCFGSGSSSGTSSSSVLPTVAVASVGVGALPLPALGSSGVGAAIWSTVLDAAAAVTALGARVVGGIGLSFAFCTTAQAPGVEMPMTLSGPLTIDYTDARTRTQTREDERGGVPVYRVWGGASGPLGQSWTTLDPRTDPQNYRDRAGLPHVNTGQYLSTGILINTTGVIFMPGVALEPTIGGTTGGWPEVRVPNPATQIQITDPIIVLPPPINTTGR